MNSTAILISIFVLFVFLILRASGNASREIKRPECAATGMLVPVCIRFFQALGSDSASKIGEPSSCIPFEKFAEVRYIKKAKLISYFFHRGIMRGH